MALATKYLKLHLMEPLAQRARVQQVHHLLAQGDQAVHSCRPLRLPLRPRHQVRHKPVYQRAQQLGRQLLTPAAQAPLQPAQRQQLELQPGGLHLGNRVAVSLLT